MLCFQRSHSVSPQSEWSSHHVGIQESKMTDVKNRNAVRVPVPAPVIIPAPPSDSITRSALEALSLGLCALGALALVGFADEALEKRGKKR